ncbi:hypothetical protein LTR35_008802 [Friedmanniomyces endolithicus]|nr:hypothetical protein LTR35_008802 [Friedmanniomyces endolithicus]KAK0295015.1 hypothetical protein LTS00_006481 [Friedmanniomyces endolithicus]KAK0990667.1 hypothetical protein LTR54_012027 [Friedmanniomyces endolithicus]
MLARSLQMLLLLPAALRLAFAQTSNSSTACNNSPDLCQRAYNNITHLGAHDSPFVRDASTGYSLSGNQYYNTTVQLAAGVRLLSAQVQTNSSSGQLSVCHTRNFAKLAARSQHMAGGESKRSRHHPARKRSQRQRDRSRRRVRSCGHNQHRLHTNEIFSHRTVAFVATLTDNAGAPYLMNEFDYIFENSYQNTAPTDFSCTANRPDNVANNTSGALGAGMMPLMNHFLYANETLFEMPNTTYLATTNAPSGGVGNLGDAAAQCTSEYGRVPTFVLVDFFNVGPAISAVDRLNGVTAPVGRTGVSTAVASASSTSGAGIMSAGWGKGVVVMLCLTIWAIGGGF